LPGASPRLPAAEVATPDWHNLRAQLLGELEERLDAAPDDAARERLLDAVRAALDPAAGGPRPGLTSIKA